MQVCSDRPVFRFAPSPNGFLHLGHAYSALLNQQMARQAGGRLLLRIEDIDTRRCRPAFVEALFADLEWLGIDYERPAMRQSERFAVYQSALDRLCAAGLVYPCFCSRSEIGRAVAARGCVACDPDGAPLYPGTCRAIDGAGRAARIAAGEPFSLRLDMAAALGRTGPVEGWHEDEEGLVPARPSDWGDVILGRKEIPTSYHLAVVIDDAAQGVTSVVRGRDLYHATSVHRLLQTLLGLPAPSYHHHALLTDEGGEKLAKSRLSKPLRALRAEGLPAADVRAMLGFPAR